MDKNFRSHASRNRKVTIEDDRVIKWHKTGQALHQEVQDVEALGSLDKEPLANGWTIRVPEIFEVDKHANSYTMERLFGDTLDEIIKTSHDDIPWKNIGKTLAIYHRKNQYKKGFVYTFGDFNRSNILIDKDKKVIGIIDPGIRHGRRAVYWRDILVFERSLWYAQMKYFCWLRKEAALFRAGYLAEFSLNKLPSAKFWPELSGQWPAILHGASKISFPKKILYMLWGVFWLVAEAFDLKK